MQRQNIRPITKNSQVQNQRDAAAIRAWECSRAKLVCELRGAGISYTSLLSM